MVAARKRTGRLKKVVDAETEVRCEVGSGLIREEVWEDADGNTARFNLTFINHHLFPGDSGRVLGYDTAHGHLHRHFKGEARAIPPTSYSEILDRFIGEVGELRRKKEL